MPNPWKLLAEQLGSNEETHDKKTVIICAPNVESLKQFEARYLPAGCKFINSSVDVLGFTSTEVEVDATDKSGCEILELDAYTVSFPLTSVALEYLNAMVELKNGDDCNLHWVFLLDWSMSNQRLWLQELISSIDLLSNSGIGIPAGTITACCVNTENIYTWQKNTTQWLAQHVDFIQQSLRSFCLLKRCSLLYCTTLQPSSPPSDIDKEVFLNILIGKFESVPTDLVSASELRVPWGSDSVGLIKTVSESFEPSQVLTKEFINKYRSFIPNVMAHAIQHNETPVEPKRIEPFNVDVQHELSKIYQQVQQRKDAAH